MIFDDKRYYSDPEEMEQETEEQYEEDQFEEGEYPEDEQQYEEEQYAEEDVEEEGTELDRLLDFLTRALTQAPIVPLSNKRMVNVEMCLNIVDDIRNCLPDAVRYSQQIVANRDRILRDAQNAANAKVQSADARANSAIEEATDRAQSMVNDAEDRAKKIIEEAQMRARAMIEQSEIMRHAHEEAERLCNDALAEANEQRRQAHNYTEQLLRGMERDVQATLDAVHRSIKNISGNP